MDHGVGVVEHNVRKIARHSILQHSHSTRLLHTGKNVKGGRSA